MRKVYKIIWLHVIIIVSVLVAYLAALNLLSYFERIWNNPVKLTFELPFPKDLEKKYNLEGESSDIDPIKVVVTGFFSDWDPNNDNYEMERISDTKWEIMINFPPGDNQYKFVVHEENTDPYSDNDLLYWVYDKNSSILVDDSFGGYNSVCRIPSAKNIRNAINISFIGILLIIILFAFLQPLFLFILKLKIKFRFKIITNALIFGLLTNFLFIALNIYQQRDILKETVIDSINLIHLYLRGERLDFEDIDFENETLKIKLNKIFYSAKARIEKDKISNNQVTLSSLAIFNTDFEIVQYVVRGEAVRFLENRLDLYSKDNLLDYFQDIVYKDLINEMKKSHKINESSFGRLVLPDDTYEHKKYSFLVGFTQIIHPIFYKGSLVGYYGAEFNVHLFGKMIENNLFFSLSLLPILVVLYYFLFSIVGKWITRRLNLLLEYTEKIKNGNYTFQGAIKSGDEIEHLSTNFGVMCKHLEDNFDKINKQNEELTELKNNLEIKVQERTVELKDTLLMLEDANKKLEEMSIKDPLTNVYNRRYFDELSVNDLHKAIRAKQSISLIMVDLDDFKQINDKHGHLVGDDALKAAVRAIEDNIKRSGDVLARYGGEEFVVMLSDIDKKGVEHICEDIRAAIAKITLKNGKVKLSASLGVCSGIPNSETMVNDYVKFADDALYKAKAEGKNCIRYKKLS